MTYNVFGGTLSLTQSINLSNSASSWRHVYRLRLEPHLGIMLHSNKVDITLSTCAIKGSNCITTEIVDHE